MIVLELFAGTRSISKAFEKHGHKTYSIDWNKAIVLDYEVEDYDKPHAINHFSFPEVKFKETTYEIGMVYAYVKEGEE